MNKKPASSSSATKSGLKKAPGKNHVLSLFMSDTFWLKLIIIGQMILLGFQFTPNISTNGDDAVYYILGKSLASGQGYRNIQLSGSPIATSFPIVFPAFLAVTHFFTDTPLIAKVLVACFGCLAIIASFYLFRMWIGRCLIPLILFISCLSVSNQHALELMSEIPYVVLTLLSIILLEKSYRQPEKKWLFWLAVFISILPMNCRSIGMAYSGAFIIANLWNKKFKYAIAHIVVLAVSVVLFKMLTSWNTAYIVQLLQVNTYDPEQGYASVSEMISRFTGNIWQYSTGIVPDALFPSFVHANPKLAGLLGVCSSSLIAVGCVRTFFLPFRFVGLYTIFYCGILSLWQTQWSSGRFLAGIMPFLVLLFFLGISSIGELIGRLIKRESGALRALLMNNSLPMTGKAPILLYWIITVCCLFDNIDFQIKNVDQRRQVTRDWEYFFSCADWIRQNTPKDAIVVSRKTEHVFLRSGRQGMLYPLSRDKEKVIEEIKKQHASYILVDGFFWTQTTQRYLYPALAAHPEFYRIVYMLRNPDTYVLRIITN